MSVSGEFDSNNSHRRIYVDSDSTLYDLWKNERHVGQKQKHSSLDVFLTASWTRRLSKAWQMNMSCDWNLIHNSVSASASVDDFIVPVQGLTTDVYDYSFSFSKKKGFLHLDGGMMLAGINSRYENNRIVVLPNVSMELAFTKTNSVTLAYNSFYKTDNNAYISGSMIDDYRRYTVFTGLHDILHRVDRLRLSINYFDILNNFTFIMNTGCTFTDNPYVYDFQSSGRSVSAVLKRNGRDASMQYAYLNIKKGFLFPLILTFKANASNSLSQTSYQGLLSGNGVGQSGYGP